MTTSTYSVTYTAHTLTPHELMVGASIFGGLVLIVGAIIGIVLWRVLRKKPEPR